MGHLLNQVNFMKILTVRNIKWFYMSEHNISVTNARVSEACEAFSCQQSWLFETETRGWI